MKKHLDILSKKYSALMESDLISFADIAAKKNVMGVYIVYSAENEIIYIGSTNKFHVRFGTDLKHETTHTLTRKLLKHEVFPDRKTAVEYLKNKCRFRVEQCETKREAEAVEHFAIWVLNPKYNK
jgi:hypothetical protein